MLPHVRYYYHYLIWFEPTAFPGNTFWRITSPYFLIVGISALSAQLWKFNRPKTILSDRESTRMHFSLGVARFSLLLDLEEDCQAFPYTIDSPHGKIPASRCHVIERVFRSPQSIFSLAGVLLVGFRSMAERPVTILLIPREIRRAEY